MPFTPPPGSGGTAGASSVIFLDEGSAIGTASGTAIINYVGAGVTGTFSGGTTTVTVSGSSNLAGTAFTRTAGNYTTAGTTFADIDTANLGGTIVTGAHRVLVGWNGAMANNNNATSMMMDLAVDGSRVGGTLGYVYYDQHATASEFVNVSSTYLTAPLSAGTHTFFVQWRVGAGTATLTANGNIPFHFWIAEQNI